MKSKTLKYDKALIERMRQEAEKVLKEDSVKKELTEEEKKLLENLD